MQCFFALSRNGIDRDDWSKRKFDEHVTCFIKVQPGVTIADLEEDTKWPMYKALIPVDNKVDALALRKEVERRCKLVLDKCRPYYFRFRNADVPDVHSINLFGLTPKEAQEFRDKAPMGKIRYISV